jgi:hypothetical protein
MSRRPLRRYGRRVQFVEKTAVKADVMSHSTDCHIKVPSISISHSLVRDRLRIFVCIRAQSSYRNSGIICSTPFKRGGWGKDPPKGRSRSHSPMLWSYFMDDNADVRMLLTRSPIATVPFNTSLSSRRRACGRCVWFRSVPMGRLLGVHFSFSNLGRKSFPARVQKTAQVS